MSHVVNYTTDTNSFLWTMKLLEEAESTVDGSEIRFCWFKKNAIPSTAEFSEPLTVKPINP